MSAEAMTGDLWAVLALAEIALVAISGFVLLQRSAYRFAEAASVAIVAALAVFSSLIQAAFLLRVPGLLAVAEILLVAGAVVVLVRHRELLGEGWGRCRRFFRLHPIASGTSTTSSLAVGAS